MQSTADRAAPFARDIATPLAWALAALSLTLAVGSLAVVAAGGEPWLTTHVVFGTTTAVSYAVVGALVGARQPRNPIGWMFAAVGLCAALTEATGAVVRHNIPPAADVARWLGLWVWIPASFLPLTLILLLFPDGRLPSPRWRSVAWASGVGVAAYTLVSAIHPRSPNEPNPTLNAYGISGADGILNALLAFVVSPLLVMGVIGAAAGVVVRFRRAHGAAREQLKWLAYGGVLALLGVTATILALTLAKAWGDSRLDEQAAQELMVSSVAVALTIIVLAAGVAMLRHRLYDIDFLISRTLVYGALTAGVVGLYVLIVGALGAVFQSSGNPAIALLATGSAALVAQLLRARLQRRVNHLLYGARDDPYTVLSNLSQQLKATLAPSAVLPTMARVVAQTLKLRYVALALERGTGLEIVAAYGQPTGDAVHLAVIYQGETIGQLLVAQRGAGESFTTAERRLLEDIALQTGVAAQAVRLTADLQQSRQRLVAAREEERRRLRRDLHDGLGPQLASLTLTLAAVRELLRQDVDTADRLLQELAIHAQTATSDIRRVVYALRPPALDDLGLVLALREQAVQYDRAGLQIALDVPERLPPLPAAVEVAAYRIVQEALTNVVRHADARTCIVRLALCDALEVTIQDDGVGLPRNGRSGVGLTSIRERTAELGGTCTIDTMPGSGTCVQVRLPIVRDGSGCASAL